MRRASNYLKTGLVTLLGSIFGLAALAPLASAASSSMYLSPASKSVSKGQAVTESIYINTGSQQADTVNVVVKYDTSKLQYVSYSTGNSKFAEFNGTFSNSGGEVKWVGTYLGNSTTGKQFVGDVTFKARASSGSTSLSLPGSNIARAGTALNPALSGATVRFSGSSTGSSQPNNPSGGNGGSSSGQSGSSDSKNDSKSSSKTPKKVSGDVKLTALKAQYTIASLTLEGKSPTTVSISYGVSKSNLRQTAKTTNLAKKYSLTLKKLMPATEYFYRVATVSKSGSRTTGEVQTFTTKAFDVSVTVRDQNGKALKDQAVTLDSGQPATTDGQGMANFSNVTPGLHQIIYTTDGHTYTGKITVKNNVETKNGQQTAALQKVSVILPFVQPDSGGSKWLVLVIVVIVIILLVAFRKRLARLFRRH